MEFRAMILAIDELIHDLACNYIQFKKCADNFSPSYQLKPGQL